MAACMNASAISPNNRAAALGFGILLRRKCGMSTVRLDRVSESVRQIASILSS